MGAERTPPTAIVTGSSSGIGLATAARLVSEGWQVVMHGLEAEELGRAAAGIDLEGARTAQLAGDVVEPGLAGELAALARARFGGVDGVVNNAGTGMTREFEGLADGDWERLVQMHLLAGTRLLREVSDDLHRSGGAVVNVSSVASSRGIPGRVGYGAAKAALDGLTRQLAGEWGPRGVRVNGVSPGTIGTPLVEANLERGLLDREAVIERTPLGRFGRPEEVAGVIAFLLGSDASYLSGQVIAVDGGWTSWGGWR